MARKMCELCQDSFAPAEVWSAEHVDWFVDAAFQAIEANYPADGWTRLRDEIIARFGDGASFIPPLPETPLGRLEWLERLQYTHDPLSEDSQILYLVGMLLRQISVVEHVSAPYAVAERLFALAVDRPVLLKTIVDWCNGLPILLADIALTPVVCALGCAIIGEHQYPPLNPMSFGTIDRTADDRENAFSDAVMVLASLYEADTVSAADLAALFIWAFHEHGVPFAEHREELVRRLLRVVEGQTLERVQCIVAALQRSEDHFLLGRPSYAAALKIVGATSVDNAVEPGQFAIGYVRAIQEAAYGLSVRHIDEDAAAIIVRLAASDPTGPPALGRPNVLFALTVSDDPNESEYSEELRLARAIRAHVRVLCRSLGRLDFGARARALDSLVRAVRYGACGKESGGSVSAFAVRFEYSPQTDGDQPITDDLAAALAACGDSERSQLFDAITELDEPYTLARLCTLVEPDLRSKLEARLKQLGPDDAGMVRAHPDAQLRIDALLDAGLPDDAIRFADNERGLRTLGQVPRRELNRYVQGLRIKVLQRDWPALYRVSVPNEIPDIDRQSAQESALFYHGVANLLDPNGSPEGAEQTFTQLSWRNPHVPAYAVNLIVARVRQLFGESVFELLPDDRRAQALGALTDAERAMTSLSGTDDDRDAVNGYRALLLLGLGRPEDALQLLSARLAATKNRYVLAVGAVAQHRLGETSAAQHTLAAARERLGDAEVFAAAGAVVAGEAPPPVTLALDTSDDKYGSLRIALNEFLESPPPEQAKIINGKHTLTDLATEVVCDASIALVELIPVLHPNRVEDHYNALLHQLIRARSLFLRWVVEAETPGGTTAKGNHGYRDIVVKYRMPEYVLLEGVVARDSAAAEGTIADLRQHFVKLFAYTTCTVFVLVVYAETSDIAALVALLKSIADKDALEDYEPRDIVDFPKDGSAPSGFTKYYYDKNEDRTISVVFLVLNVGRRVNKKAADIADGLNKRN